VRKAPEPSAHRTPNTATTGSTVERVAELARLRLVLEAARDGRGGVVVLEGIAGAGKTHLLEVTASLSRELGLRTLRGSASPLGGAASFGLALELLEPLLESAETPQHLARLFNPEYRLAEPDDGTAAQACIGLAQLCERVAAGHSLALLVDDVHWGDPASLRALAVIARRAASAGIALVTAIRLGEEATDEEAIAELRGGSPAEVIGVGPLTPAGVGALLESREAGSIDDPAATECARLTGGNPLLVTQVAALLRERPEPVTAESLERLRGRGSVGVAASVEARLRRLGEDAERLVAACAVLGDDASTRHAAALGDLDEPAAVAALDRLAAAGVLEPGEPPRFTHPLVRDAVYDARPVAARASDHRRAAELLAGEGADPERVASHLMHARPAGSHRSVAELIVAAEQALGRGVPEAAATYLERALAEPPAADQRAQAMLNLGFAEALLGRPGAAESLRLARAAATSPRLRAEADLRLGRHLYSSGGYAEAARAFERGRAELGDGDPGDWLGAELDACSLAAARYAGNLDERDSERLTEMLERDRPGETPTERALLAELALEHGVRGAPRDRVVSLAMRAWAGGTLPAESDRHGIVVSQVAAALVFSDAYEEVEEVVERAAEHAEETGAPASFATARYMRSWLRLYRGELAGALEDTATALATSGWDMYRPAAHCVRAHAHIERAELDAAAAALELPGGDDAWSGSVPFALMIEARGRLATLRGDDEAALRDLLACGEVVSPMGDHQPYSRWRVHAALCLDRLGDHDRARRLAAAELDAARGAGAPRVLGTALLAQGALTEGEAGVALLREAVEVLAGSGARLEHARALCRLGERLRRLERPVEAREPLRESLALADGLDATLVAEQAAAELTAAGGRSRRRALSGPDSLTPAERRVARLAAAGQTNRAIAAQLVVAEKTVQFHLTNAYRKLGVESRDELGQALL
jgi:DNA-binding CsgD family transcriptional regulator